MLRDERRPLPPAHGFPVRLIAPGWYGVANVKWLTRIEVLDTRYQGHFMARDYVTIREEARRRDRLDLHLGRARPAQVGAGEGDRRGEPLPDHGRRLGRADRRGGGADRRRAVEAGDADDRRGGGRGTSVRLDLLDLDWGTPAAGEHTITSRAIDVDGDVQPAPDDPYLAGKTTFWESNGQITRRVDIPSR